MRTVESYIDEFMAKKQKPAFVGNLDCGLIELSHTRHRRYIVSQVDTTVTITIGFFSESFELTKTKNGMYPHRQRVWKAMKALNAKISQPEWTDITNSHWWEGRQSAKSNRVFMQWADMFGVHVSELVEKVDKQFKLVAAIHHPDKGGNGYIFDNYVYAREQVKFFDGLIVKGDGSVAWY